MSVAVVAAVAVSAAVDVDVVFVIVSNVAARVILKSMCKHAHCSIQALLCWCLRGPDARDPFHDSSPEDDSSASSSHCGK